MVTLGVNMKTVLKMRRMTAVVNTEKMKTTKKTMKVKKDCVQDIENEGSEYKCKIVLMMKRMRTVKISIIYCIFDYGKHEGSEDKYNKV